MQSRKPSRFRDPIWQFIGVLVAVVTFAWAVFVWVIPNAGAVFNRSASSNSASLHNNSITAGTSTTTPMPTPTLASMETIPENIVLKCNECSDPVVVTITSIKVEPQNNRMIWALSLFNNSQANQNCSFQQFSLQNPIDDKTFDSTMPYCSSLDADETTTFSATFSFIPYTKVAYTLDASIYDRNAHPLPFLPVQVTF